MYIKNLICVKYSYAYIKSIDIWVYAFRIAWNIWKGTQKTDK